MTFCIFGPLVDFAHSLRILFVNVFHSSNPAETFRHCRESGQLCAFTFDHRCYYLPGAPVVGLLAVLATSADGSRLLLVSNQVGKVREWLRTHHLAGDNMAALAGCAGAPWVPLAGAWRLGPVSIAKPWGREIWYTGIEERGQSTVTDGCLEVPLPWLLALDPEQFLAARTREPNLVKILDPLDEAVFGDLYFELHEEKQEVYVVTHVSDAAWPGGKGAIRYGFDPAVRARYPDDNAFRQAYLDAVHRYEAVRREVDACLDRFREEEGVALEEPLSPRILKAWQARLDGTLRDREVEAREAMNAFTHLVPLSRGDVVRIATRSPHALQHGVRTVEFQTPVYERKILSFAQKVLTQPHWDTAEAVAMMNLEPGAVETLPRVAQGDGFALDRVVAFDDFRVHRLTLGAGQTYSLARGDHYCVLFAVAGDFLVADLPLAPEEAVLLPRTSAVSAVVNRGSSEAILLISEPVQAAA